MFACMTDREDAGIPRLETLAGEPIEIDDSVGRAFAEAVRNGTAEPSEALALWWSLSRPDGGAHIKVTEDEDGRWVITDVYVHGRGLTVTDLQALPLTQLNLTMNLIGYWDGSGAIMDPAAITDVINGYAANAGYGQAVMHNLDEDAAEPTLAELRSLAAAAPPDLPRGPEAERPQLTRPDGTDPDGFAERVAAAYREYVTKTRAPAVEIAKEAGVPVGTVRGWIREARRRGKLPQGHRGKVG
jgi:hypothetical protein